MCQCILAGGSKLFESLFFDKKAGGSGGNSSSSGGSGSPSAAEKKACKLDGLEAYGGSERFHDVLRFYYLGDVDPTVDNLVQFYGISEYLGSDALKKVGPRCDALLFYFFRFLIFDF